MGALLRSSTLAAAARYSSLQIEPASAGPAAEAMVAALSAAYRQGVEIVLLACGAAGCAVQENSDLESTGCASIRLDLRERGKCRLTPADSIDGAQR